MKYFIIRLILSCAIVLSMVPLVAAQQPATPVVRIGDWVEVGHEVLMNIIAATDIRYRTTKDYDFESRLVGRELSRDGLVAFGDRPQRPTLVLFPDITGDYFVRVDPLLGLVVYDPDCSCGTTPGCYPLRSESRHETYDVQGKRDFSSDDLPRWATSAEAQSLSTSNRGDLGPSEKHINQLARDTQHVIKTFVREDIKTTTQQSMPRPMRVTSEDRTTPRSAAHDRGAIDIRSHNVSAPQRHQEAKEISRHLGPHYTTVVEEVHRPAPGQPGPSAQTNTSYRDGALVRQSSGPVKATGTHTHIQPDYGIRIP